MIYLGLDDTDTPQTGGTGRLARRIANALSSQFTVLGVTRHQLLQDPRVPCTKKNSAACIPLDADVSALPTLQDWIPKLVGKEVRQGSDPGICITADVPDAVIHYARAVKTSLVTQAGARSLARDRGIYLRGLGGDESGVIGALAAVGLAADGNDGRYVLVGRIRDLRGLLSVEDILQAGVISVQTLAGQVIRQGKVKVEKLRPARRGGMPVLFVEKGQEHWLPLKLD